MNVHRGGRQLLTAGKLKASRRGTFTPADFNAFSSVKKRRKRRKNVDNRHITSKNDKKRRKTSKNVDIYHLLFSKQS